MILTFLQLSFSEDHQQDGSLSCESAGGRDDLGLFGASKSKQDNKDCMLHTPLKIASSKDNLGSWPK